MGVPKFFRYVSERYPCLSQLILENEIPEFDYLYLDMNGIIHNCSHPNDYDPHFRITEDKIFEDICKYVEMLFRIIAPQKVFFMAVDGVAPRAKMNQQRARRFRSAKDAEDKEQKVLSQGNKLPEADRFDSNCITPGTIFMEKLQIHLKYFICSKISTDRMWKNVKVIFSGHDCPGEGEHKIMEYIRYLRLLPEYEPNSRHCLYGLDADLIMLGLCSHEPHFALLREEVKLGSKNQNDIAAQDDTKFFLLHLCILREYIEMEFSELKTKLPFEFNLESVIDDWVLLGFLVGNDFIPNLPELHINCGALPILHNAYREVLPTLDGYLNETGTLNLSRFQKFMKKLGSYDIKQFRKKYEKTNTAEEHEPNKQQFVGKHLENCDDQAIQDMMDMEEDEGIMYYYDKEERDKDRLLFLQEFHLHKRSYYQEKLKYTHVTAEVIRNQAEGYVTALQWNLDYYYNGICSWSWFYPHHYAPYISDVQNFKDMKIEFDLGKPFLPFEQLLAVLPASSKNLLPEPFQKLMTSGRSPIFKYYPSEFETDLNGKNSNWEAVILIPFIDQEKLLKAMEPCYSRLSDVEKERNKHGPMHVYTYTGENLGRYEASANFSAVEENHALDAPIYREDIVVPRDQLRRGLLPGVLLDIFLPGFPTFKPLKFTHILEPKGVRIFQFPSQGLNMIVKPFEVEEAPSLEFLANMYLSKIIHVFWPYLIEAKVISLYTREEKYSLESGQVKNELLNDDQKREFDKECETLKHQFLKSRGVDIGDKIEVIFNVRVKEGQKFVFTNKNEIKVEKKWSNKLQSFPIQLTVRELKTKSIENSSKITLDQVFPVGTDCLILKKSFYGSLGRVSSTSKNCLVNVRVKVVPEPNEIRTERTKIRYYNVRQTQYRAKVSYSFVVRITGTVFILDTENLDEIDKCPKVNIGLNLKFNRRNQYLPGYTKRDENNKWLFSDKAVALIREYGETFPDVLKYFEENPDYENILKSDLLPSLEQDPQQKTEILKKISEWLDRKYELKAERRSCDAELLESDIIENLECQIDSFKKTKELNSKFVNTKLKPKCLYRPSFKVEHDSQDPAEFRLLDRIVNIRDNFVVPFGLRGTVIGWQKVSQGLTMYYDIVFDEPFNNGKQYHTKKKCVYKVPEKYILNITHVNRKYDIEKVKIQSKVPTSHSVPSAQAVTHKQNVSDLVYLSHSKSSQNDANKWVEVKQKRRSKR